MAISPEKLSCNRISVVLYFSIMKSVPISAEAGA